MENKVCVITGANSGIGRETARALAAAGARVVMCSRDHARGEAALADVRATTGSEQLELLDLDLSRLDSVRRAADTLHQRHDKIDVLINNAGLLLSERQLTADGFEMVFGVCHLGHFLLTRLVLDLVEAAAPARIINVSSEAHRAARRGINFDDLAREQRYQQIAVYAEAKLANLLFTRSLARRLDAQRVTANSLHPGTIRSGFGRDGDTSGWMYAFNTIARPLLIGPVRGARTSIFLATAPELAGKTGGYYIRSRLRKAFRAAHDDEAADRLWSVSEQMVGLS